MTRPKPKTAKLLSRKAVSTRATIASNAQQAASKVTRRSSARGQPEPALRSGRLRQDAHTVPALPDSNRRKPHCSLCGQPMRGHGQKCSLAEYEAAVSVGADKIIQQAAVEAHHLKTLHAHIAGTGSHLSDFAPEHGDQHPSSPSSQSPIDSATCQDIGSLGLTPRVVDPLSRNSPTLIDPDLSAMEVDFEIRPFEQAIGDLRMDVDLANTADTGMSKISQPVPDSLTVSPKDAHLKLCDAEATSPVPDDDFPASSPPNTEFEADALPVSCDVQDDTRRTSPASTSVPSASPPKVVTAAEVRKLAAELAKGRVLSQAQVSQLAAGMQALQEPRKPFIDNFLIADEELKSRYHVRTYREPLLGGVKATPNGAVEMTLYTTSARERSSHTYAHIKKHRHERFNAIAQKGDALAAAENDEIWVMTFAIPKTGAGELRQWCSPAVLADAPAMPEQVRKMIFDHLNPHRAQAVMERTRREEEWQDKLLNMRAEVKASESRAAALIKQLENTQNENQRLQRKLEKDPKRVRSS